MTKPARITRQGSITRAKQNSGKAAKRKAARRSRTVRTPAAVGRVTIGTSTLSKIARDGSASLFVREVFPVSGVVSSVLGIPVTPTKWTGTRASALASTFASHRPLYLHVRWVPSISTQTPGSIVLGTGFAGTRPVSDPADFNQLINQLKPTPGGFLTTGWKTMGSSIPLEKNLTQNQYPLYDIQSDDIPLWLLVGASSADVSGFIEVTGKFTLRNPVAPMEPPISGSGPATITHDDDAQTTTLAIDNQYLNKPPNLGEEIAFSAMKNLKNLAGGVISRVMTAVIGTVIEGVSGYTTLKLDPNFASQSSPIVIIGRSANF